MTDNLQPSVERTCRKCGAVKLLEEFAVVYAKNSRGVNYRQHTCKECAKREHAERMRKARAKSPERYKRIQRDHRKRNYQTILRQRHESDRRRKVRILDAYGGAKCKCCGETCLSMLTIDHIDGNGGKHRREEPSARYGLYYWLEKKSFPGGFQVLCYNCNISKHRNGVCEHLNEGSTTIPSGSSPQAIGGRSAGRPRKGPKT